MALLHNVFLMTVEGLQLDSIAAVLLVNGCAAFRCPSCVITAIVGVEFAHLSTAAEPFSSSTRFISYRIYRMTAVMDLER